MAVHFRPLACVLAGIFLLAGCPAKTRRSIAVIPKGRSHLFWQSVHAGAAKAAQENNLDLIWNGPAGETDYNGQLQIVDAMINRHVDAIALAPIDKNAMVSVVDRAAQQNIPMIIFDSAVETQSFVSQVATDNYKAGQMAADRMGQILSGKGSVLIVAVQPGAASTEAREKGFEDGLHSKFPGINIVDKRFGMAEIAKSLTVSENMLTAHPGVSGMFASNESSTMGAVQALRNSGKSVKLVGFDWSPVLANDLNTGLIDSLIVQDPFQMGYQSVLAAVHKLNGQPVVRMNNLSPLLVDRANVNQPKVQAQLNPDLKKYLN